MFLFFSLKNDVAKPETAIPYEPRHDKTNKMSVRPAKTQISLGIRPVWSVFAVRMKVLCYPLSAQRRLWSDWADTLADLNFHWARSHVVCFIMSQLIWAYHEKTRLGVCDSYDSNRPAQLQTSYSLEISAILYYPSSDNKDADQTARMCRLICAFVVRIWHKQVFSWRGSC